MSEFANFVTIQDGEFRMPWWENQPPRPGDRAVYTKVYSGIDLPDLNARKPAVLLWKMRNPVSFTMTFWFNGQVSVSTDPGPGERIESYHEIFPGSHLREKDNELVIAVEGPFYMVFSDVVLMYGASTDGPQVAHR